VVLGFQLVEVAVRAGRRAKFTATTLVWFFVTMVLSLGAAAASQGATVIAVFQGSSGIPAPVFPSVRWHQGKDSVFGADHDRRGTGVGIGFVLLIVPGIILALMWALTIPVAFRG